MTRALRPIAAIAIIALATAAQAEDYRLRFPNMQTLSPHGVNLQTGYFEWTQKEFAIGPLTVDWRYTSGGTNSGSPMEDKKTGVARSVRGFVNILSMNNSQGTPFNVINVRIGDQNPRWMQGSYWPFNSEALAWTISLTSGTYTLRNKSGDTYTLISNAAFSSGTKVLSVAAFADGHRLDYSYSSGNLRTVMSNRGYALVFDYSGNNITACGYNRAVTYVTTASTCAASTLKTSYTFNSEGQPTSMTDVDGAMTTIVNPVGTAGITAISYPGQPATFRQQMHYGPLPGEAGSALQGQVRRVTTANGNHWLFSYTIPENPLDVPPITPDEVRYTETYMADPQGNLTHAKYGNGLVEFIDSPAGKLTYEFNGMCPTKVTYPEGNAAIAESGPDCNIGAMKTAPKTGSQSPTLVQVSYGYTPSCVYTTKVCDKPLTKTDGNGNVTNFSWSTANGLILTELAPVVNGIRGLTWYTYAQRYALIKNSGGSFVQAATPVWVLTQKSLCKSGGSNMTVPPAPPPATPACDVASDEVVTTYDYGPTSGVANNLLLRNTVDDAGTGKLNLRTCFVYDAQGNKVAETKPRGAAGGCP